MHAETPRLSNENYLKISLYKLQNYQFRIPKHIYVIIFVMLL
jgi:hypothetical protein